MISLQGFNVVSFLYFEFLIYLLANRIAKFKTSNYVHLNGYIIYNLEFSVTYFSGIPVDSSQNQKTCRLCIKCGSNLGPMTGEVCKVL